MNKIRRVVRSEVMGFCMGVKAAMQKVDDQVLLNNNTGLFTYGPLIHNPQVISRLESQGVVAIESPSAGDGGTIIIRAHGIHPEKREEFIDSGYNVVEGTCPRVLHSQKTVSQYSRDGWFIVIVGDKGHGEVKAIVGCADNYEVILTESEAERVNLSKKTLVIAQTTLSKGEYDTICRIEKRRDPNIKVIKSICPATSQRQDSLQQLTAQVDAIIVIGGKNSANTKRLHLSAIKSGIPSWHV
ncbi:MAG: 4-hydroxy-3-methylbut-2-enyl diphosphate reductase, partial [Spirochaetales bacterium]|nr:4-hydroxy-3-methylbut-2-enyl diphosphate reductase [Spirochaetales bacterium]